METSEQLDKFGVDFAKAQSEMGGAVKDSNNPFFKSKYADLTSVWKASKEALHNNGFSVIQSPIDCDGRIGVSTLLLHKSGQWIKDKFTLGVKKQNDPQADGSSITYARRYALAAFVGVCPVDDDAEGVMMRKAKKEPANSEDLDAYIFRMEKCKTLDELNAWIESNADIIKQDLSDVERGKLNAKWSHKKNKLEQEVVK